MGIIFETEERIDNWLSCSLFGNWQANETKKHTNEQKVDSIEIEFQKLFTSALLSKSKQTFSKLIKVFQWKSETCHEFNPVESGLEYRII